MRSNLQENFYKRLKQLGGVTSTNNPAPSLSNSTLIEYSRANDGIALAIVKENHNYFIKTSNSKNEKLAVEDFAYINGVENKFKYQYNSLAEAEKNKNFFLKTLNESSSKKFKTISVNEGENVSKAQVNADSLNAGKAQIEADKAKGTVSIKDAKEKEIAKVPSVAAIAVEKKSTPKAKVVDATKGSSAKAISVDKTQIKPKTSPVAKAEKVTTIKESKNIDEYGDEHSVSVKDAVNGKVSENIDEYGDEHSVTVKDAVNGKVSENFGEEEPNDAEGSVEPELDAAAAALDDMGATEEPSMDGEDMAGEEPSMDGEDMAGEKPSMDGEDMAGDGVKDIEKLTGKVTQKIRSTELTPEMTKGLMKSYISAFADKLGELDHEDRKELANDLLKDKEEEGDEQSSMNGEEGMSPEAPTSGDDESEIEEAINQHLAEMGISEDEDVENHENVGATQKPFKKYVQERGYNPEKVEEISLMEMVGLMNSYTNECGEAPDAEGMAGYVTKEVSEKMNESGNSLFEDLMKPFGEKIKKNKKVYASEAVLPMNELFGEEDAEEEDAEEGSPENSISVGEEPEGNEDGEEELEIGDDEEEPIDIKKNISIAPAADSIAIGTPMGSATSTIGGGEHKSATVDLKNATVTLTMNESEAKLRKIVQKKINEALTGKKSSMNEGKKSPLSIMIDELVNEAIVKRRAAIEKRLMRGL
jgi:hypothetical protein